MIIEVYCYAWEAKEVKSDYDKVLEELTGGEEEPTLKKKVAINLDKVNFFHEDGDITIIEMDNGAQLMALISYEEFINLMDTDIDFTPDAD